ncbi:MAG: beta-lactamase family protein [Emcibacter sp.]|nr:beta-lactamase family protein [Emcibacter sp.]
MSVCRGIFFVVLAAHIYMNPVQAEENDIKIKIEQELDNIIGEVLDKEHIPSISINILKKGRPLYAKAFGLADVELDVPATLNSVYAIGSLTKSFTCLAINQLTSHGRISFEDTLDKFLPDYPTRAKDIKVRHLLHHTSGIKNYIHLPEIRRNAEKFHSHDDMLAWFQELPLDFEPGSQWRYSNSGTYLLGLIIEKASGEKYQDYIKNHILIPFGLENTYSGEDSRIIKGRSKGYSVVNGVVNNARRYSSTIAFASGDLLSTSADIATYMTKLYHDYAHSKSLIGGVFEVGQLEDGQNINYTNGCLFSEATHGRVKYYHMGQIFGYSSILSYYPEDEITISILTNSGSVKILDLEHRLAEKILEYLL